MGSLKQPNQGFNHYVNPPARKKRKSQTRNPPRSKTKTTQTKAQKTNTSIKKTNELADRNPPHTTQV